MKGLSFVTDSEVSLGWNGDSRTDGRRRVVSGMEIGIRTRNWFSNRGEHDIYVV